MHRLPIAQGLQKQGHHIGVLTQNTGRKAEIEALGFEFLDLPLDRKGTNLFTEAKTWLQTYKAYKAYQPDVVYQVTIKPIIYGLIAAKFLKIKTLNTVCGLGYAFSEEAPFWLQKTVSILYRFGFSKAQTITFFENTDDKKVFEDQEILKPYHTAKVVKGVGVDLDRYSPISKSIKKQKLQIILPSRMLWDKGIREFCEAAKMLQKEYQDEVCFKLYGKIDTENPQAVPESYFQSQYIKGYLEWKGFATDMKTIYQETNIVVLPSYYREGMPTVLAEAAAMGIPCISTNSVGCRDAIDHEKNGLLIPPKSTEALVTALKKLLRNPELRTTMGQKGREKAQKEFDSKKITAIYLENFKKLLND